MEPELTDRYDHALLGILQHVGNIQDFLNVYFGFLYRKTDFYRLLLSPQDRLGFPPGVAQNMVLKTFKTFERLAIQDHEQRVRELQDRLKKKEEAEAEIEQAPAPVEEVTVEAPQEEGTMEQEKTTAEAALEKTEGKAEGTDANVNSTEAAASTDNVHEDFQTNPDSYNGAVRKNYLWSQDYTDIEIKVPVPKDVIKGRQVSVDLRSTSICVKVRDKDGEHTLMDGNFTHKINAETSLWSLEPGNCILISLSKCGEYWWNAVLEGEEKIDIDKINKERSMATVDDEEHAVLDRLTFDYHQKLQGKPQSHEMKVHDMLKKGWDAEGSPFRGQTFDPSMFNISPGAVQF
ncbi:nudC domain-containing protein 3 [Spea bombifrons]|uniref:nudC domain-containing protein 3 n=1 Tax=Spea bombifrons TaxID=233779 RepID=UPI00234A984A|nr:nudC domain-containing protein 3 [Spea bombifrons]XP_053318809.1 nudC domain-containing protein 3 [Spea bombifrons]XP_053318810.1 nudC domain-containing protein 3 [Spea bombifrons]